eukprot:CAMPEP_0206025386 /NCGR_PEP_ID=MMETSP1464-20131121/39937_1 /ASSEMBLY_ACC=CAM_ASM_001124 /TAXON_ID=119497 /ORGANISM="Exanthemachrysis gayraliae, Strain RCC1523" /LENGTH=84 /DNA_ID=CAMNT_0053399421 /DNA_START=142 /DNA_END=393 /DNA_ORIENTATION=-
MAMRVCFAFADRYSMRGPAGSSGRAVIPPLVTRRRSGAGTPRHRAAAKGCRVVWDWGPLPKCGQPFVLLTAVWVDGPSDVCDAA